MNFKFYIYIIIFLINFSCNFRENSENFENAEYVIKIDVKKLQNKDFESIMYSPKTVLLQENENYIIGEISKVMMTDEYIFVLDKRKAKTIFMFHKDGSFIQPIGKMGNGEGEYTSPDAFYVDNADREVVVLDRNKRNFLFFDFNGKYLRHLRIDFPVYDFILSNNKLILDFGNLPGGPDHYLSIIDKKTGEIENSLFPTDVELQHISFAPLFPLQSLAHSFTYHPTMSTSIYEVYNNDEIKHKYQMDFGGYWPERRYLESMKKFPPAAIFEDLSKKDIVLFPNFMETEQWLHVYFLYNKNYIAFFKNKNNGNQTMVLWHKDNEISPPIGVINNQFISVKYSETASTMLLFYQINL